MERGWQSAGRLAGVGTALLGELAKLTIAPEDLEVKVEQRGSVRELIEQHAGREQGRDRRILRHG